MTKSHETTVWEFLARDVPRGQSLTARAAFDDLTDVLLAAIDSDCNRHFLIKLDSSDVPVTDNKSRGIGVETKSLNVKGSSEGNSPEGERYLDLRCQDPAGYDVFDVIGHQIAIAINEENAKISEVVRRVLSRWRYFWGRSLGNVLSREGVIGLFTELYFLKVWLLPFSNHKQSLEGWRGPHGSRHDFEFSGFSVEAKGTTTVDSTRHRINGIEQLAPPEEGRLFLFSLHLREENGGTNSLPELIKDCRDLLSDDLDVIEVFENTLATSGYSPAHDETYEGMHFRVMSSKLYEINESFPKLTPDMLIDAIPGGVKSVSYDIILDGFDYLVISPEPSADLIEKLWHEKIS